jgi:hypothetical protein
LLLSQSFAVGQIVVAHGMGGGVRDLPVPLSLTITAAVAALVVSFGVLALAWRTPRYPDPRKTGAPLPYLTAVLDSALVQGLLRTLGFISFGYVGWALLAGEDLLTNPAFGVVFVWLWVGLVPASLLLGPVLRALSPFRTLHRVICRLAQIDPAHGLYGYRSSWGYWPAAGWLLGFVWFELMGMAAAPTLASLQLWCALWVCGTVIGGLLFGDTYFSHAEPFESYSNLVAHLSPWGRRGDGTVVLRSPMANLAGLPGTPGLLALVSVLFASTGFDSFHETASWRSWIDQTGVSEIIANTVVLFTMCLVAAVVFAGGALLTTVDPPQLRRRLPAQLAHSVTPIIVGYIAAHYLSFFVMQGQETLVNLSDPLSDGSNYLGTADYVPNNWLALQPTFLATSKVLLVVLGHILGVLAAHERALTLLPRRQAVSGQLGLLAVMLIFTTVGLFLLFAN